LEYRATQLSRQLRQQTANNILQLLQTQVAHDHVRSSGTGSESQISGRSADGISVFDPPSSANPAANRYNVNKNKHRQSQNSNSRLVGWGNGTFSINRLHHAIKKKKFIENVYFR